tara:strand:+ start:2072 stop:2446 length:375 start_codon:yes stop_codon:yes gene_type:complete
MSSKIITNFLIGGIVIATTSYLVENVSTDYAALFATFPFASIPIMLGFYLQENNPTEVRNFVLALIFGSIGGILYIITYSLSSDYIFKRTKHVILYSYILSIIVWMVSTLALYKLDIDELIKSK